MRTKNETANVIGLQCTINNESCQSEITTIVAVTVLISAASHTPICALDWTKLLPRPRRKKVAIERGNMIREIVKGKDICIVRRAFDRPVQRRHSQLPDGRG